MSLRLRVLVAIALVLIVSSAVGIGLAGWQAGQSLREEFAAALTGGRQTVESAFEDLPRSDHPARDLRQLIATFDGNRHVAASLYAADGRLLLTSHSTPVRAAPAWFAALFHPRIADVRIAPRVSGYRAIVLEPVFANDVAAIWAEFVDLVLVLAVSFVVGSTLLWLTLGRALRPLSDFSAAFLRIGSGDYGAVVGEHGPLELVRLGRGVNEMARRLAGMQARTKALEAQLRTLQDEERADLARDLHDEIGPQLFAVNVDAAVAQRLIAAGKGIEAQGQIEAIQKAVAHMQRLVRDILGRLRPTELIELGLVAAIGELIAFWSARHRDITFDVRLVPDESAIPSALHETLYRVVQEGLNNAIRHGHPRRIEVEISLSADGEVVARVTDDGAAAAGAGGFGLLGMRERVAAAHGRLAAGRNTAGHGWSVVARLPVNADVAEKAA
jgi:two-component system sensor histidine kinase UhpB